MEGLFFAVQPIWWEGKISLFQIFLFGIVCFSILFIGRLYRLLGGREKIKGEVMSFPDYTTIDPTDKEFASKTLTELKKLIAYYYTPEHTHAHTVREIGKYLFDSHLVDVGTTLETSIYTGLPLNTEQCREINATIHDFVTQSQVKLDKPRLG